MPAPNQLLIFGATLLATAGHEAGHYVAARCLGVRTYGFRLNLKGIGLARDFGSPIQNLAITLAGPMANFLLMGVILLTPWLGVLAVWATFVNFVIGAFNLLPVPGSDGMRALSLLRDSRRNLHDTMVAAGPINDST